MIPRFTRALAAVAALVFAELGIAPHQPAPPMASGRIAASALPYLPGSTIPLTVDDIPPPYSLDLIGAGTIDRGQLHVPQTLDDESATVIASGAKAIAVHRFAFAAPPSVDTTFIAVAAYDNGIVIHDGAPPFSARAVLGIGGAPADVAIDSGGRLAAGDTSGATVSIAALAPWNVREVQNVPLTDELAFDASTNDLFATNRDLGGNGALTRIAPDGTVTRRILGITSEGIAIDARRHRAYVANTNDGTVSIVDTVTMNELKRFYAIDRIFSLALSDDAKLLYAVSNQSMSSPFGAAGSVVAIDVSARTPRIVARSGRLSFPIGIAFDGSNHRLFVSDEHDDAVDVLDATTLRPTHTALRTCRTPWKLSFDPLERRLYVPCAQADAVDVFDTRTLRHAQGAPFATGGYPLAVAVWHPRTRVVH